MFSTGRRGRGVADRIGSSGPSASQTAAAWTLSLPVASQQPNQKSLARKRRQILFQTSISLTCCIYRAEKAVVGSLLVAGGDGVDGIDHQLGFAGSYGQYGWP